MTRQTSSLIRLQAALDRLEDPMVREALEAVSESLDAIVNLGLATSGPLISIGHGNIAQPEAPIVSTWYEEITFSAAYYTVRVPGFVVGAIGSCRAFSGKWQPMGYYNTVSTTVCNFSLQQSSYVTGLNESTVQIQNPTGSDRTCKVIVFYTDFPGGVDA